MPLARSPKFVLHQPEWVSEMNPKVVGVSGPLQGKTLVLSQGEFSIGRDPSNSLWIADPALSRKHCLLVRNDDEIILRDLESRNGTLVNGEQVAAQSLQHGDHISVGDSVFVFFLTDDPNLLRKNRVVIAETTELATTELLIGQNGGYSCGEKPEAQSATTARVTRDLNALLKIATGIGGIRDLDSLQWQLLGLIFDVVAADRGAVLISDSPDEFPSAIAWDRVLGPGRPVRISRTIIRKVFQERVGLVVSDTVNRDALKAIPTLADLQVRSVLCVPLLLPGNRPMGAIYLDSRSQTELFDESHLQTMTAVAGIVSLAIDNVRHWERLQQENEELRAEIDLEHDMVGNSPRMREVFEFIRRVAPTDSTVLITGESGTGKELVARAVHRNSPRSSRSFVAINCAAIAETLLESELFGHERGAFTGATQQKKGKIEIAEGGTLFLDEISELAPALQAKLLRVLQEREFERLGGHRPIKLDVRVIAATNKNLMKAISDGTFRSDLFYRLNVVAVNMPPLRDRLEDIPALAQYFIEKASRKCNIKPRPLSPEARTYL